MIGQMFCPFLRQVLICLHRHQEHNNGSTLNHITILNNAALKSVVTWFKFLFHVMSFTSDGSSTDSDLLTLNNKVASKLIKNVDRNIFSSIKNKSGFKDKRKGKGNDYDVKDAKEKVKTYSAELWKKGTQWDISLCAYLSMPDLKINSNRSSSNFSSFAYFKDESFNSIQTLSRRVEGIVTQIATLYITSSLLSVIEEVGFDNFTEKCHFEQHNKKDVKSQIFIYLLNIFDILPCFDTRSNRKKVPLYVYNCVFQNMFLICQEMKLFQAPDFFLKAYQDDLERMHQGEEPQMVSLPKIKDCLYRMVRVLHLHFHITYESIKKNVTCKVDANESVIGKIVEEKYSPFTQENKHIHHLPTIDDCDEIKGVTSNVNILDFTEQANTELDKNSVKNISDWMIQYESVLEMSIEYLIKFQKDKKSEHNNWSRLGKRSSIRIKQEEIKNATLPFKGVNNIQSDSTSPVVVESINTTKRSVCNVPNPSSNEKEYEQNCALENVNNICNNTASDVRDDTVKDKGVVIDNKEAVNNNDAALVDDDEAKEEAMEENNSSTGKSSGTLSPLADSTSPGFENNDNRNDQPQSSSKSSTLESSSSSRSSSGSVSSTQEDNNSNSKTNNENESKVANDIASEK